MTTLTLTKMSLFPLLLVYICVPIADHSNFESFPSSPPKNLSHLYHIDVSSEHPSSSGVAAYSRRYKLRNLRIGKNVDNGSVRVLGCGKLSLGWWPLMRAFDRRRSSGPIFLHCHRSRSASTLTSMWSDIPHMVLRFQCDSAPKSCLNSCSDINISLR